MRPYRYGWHGIRLLGVDTFLMAAKEIKWSYIFYFAGTAIPTRLGRVNLKFFLFKAVSELQVLLDQCVSFESSSIKQGKSALRFS